ncbi:MAG: tRNA nucleotidyltransferase [Oscillospiraceae bacterium]|nr:tRNA nucleotidyltransferase [Oscillospiraceae bacterium]
MSDRNREMAVSIARRAAESGGTAYYVGGCVRDRLRQIENKDVDIEVHGLWPAQLEAILSSLGECIAVGESFGVYNLKGYSLDIAMPRREKKRGDGHRDFDVSVDPFLGTCGAARRRDFTVNALMENVLTGELVDHFGGVRDLERGVLRHVCDESFAEDPLRVLRAAQFAARFGFTVAEETVALCSRMELGSLSRERVMGELEKALLKAEKPSVFFETLREMDQLSVWFTELAQTLGAPQSRRHHPEGDVWTHTMQVCDRAVLFREQAREARGFMLAALCHDLGKTVCTEFSNGDWHSYGHETAGLPLTESFLRRLTAEKALIEYVLNLCALHMKPNRMAADGASVKATNRMFDAALDPEALLCLAAADKPGRDPACERFLRERLAVYRDYMARPCVMGRDLIGAGVAPSERFAGYLDYAHKCRLAGIPKEEALKQTLALARKQGDLEG